MYANNGGKVIRAHLIECDSLRCMLYIFLYLDWLLYHCVTVM